MKENRIAEYVNELRDIGEKYGDTQQLRERFKYLFIDALKEQDRDTRHACAEAIIRIRREGKLVGADLAHDICMNVHSFPVNWR